MKIKAIAPWFGGKRTLAPDIVQQLGKHTQYFEPFCGSMAVLFAKPVATMETVNDLNGDLINLARVVQDDSMSVRLFERCHRTLCAEDNFNDLAGVVKAFAKGPAGGPPNLDRAYAYFVTSWLGRNGVAGTEFTAFPGLYASCGIHWRAKLCNPCIGLELETCRPCITSSVPVSSRPHFGRSS